MTETPEAPKKSNAARNLLALALLAGVAVAAYKFWLPTETKDAINRVASVTGVTVTPWVDRADAALKAMLAKPGQSDVIGKSITSICHPTGIYVKVEKEVTRKEGDTLVLELQIGWKGGIVGTAYSTQVRWSCHKDGHIKAETFGDNSVTGVAKDNAKALDEYFHTNVWPAVSSNAGS